MSAERSRAERSLIRDLKHMIDSMSSMAASHREEAATKTGKIADTDYGRGLLVGDAIGMEHAVRRLSRAVERFEMLRDDPVEEAV